MTRLFSIFILLFVVTVGAVGQQSISAVQKMQLDDLRMFTTPMNELMAASNSHQVSQLYDSTCFNVMYTDSTKHVKSDVLILYHLRKEVAYWPNGEKRFERYYYNRKPFGTWKYWDTGNHLKYFIYNIDEKHLIVQVFYPNGNLRSERSYHLDKDKFIEKNYTLEGHLSSFGNRVAIGHQGGENTPEQGVWQYYYVSGQLKEEGKFEYGNKVGKWKFYDLSGELTRLIWFKDGKTVKQQSLTQKH